MIRVGFVILCNGNGWMGGVNYMINLVHAIARIEDRQIEPVLIVSPTTPAKVLDRFPPWQILHTVLVNSHHNVWTITRKLTRLLLGRDVLMERFLKRNNIDVLSHAEYLGQYATIPTIGWIPDFQHQRMPEFFSPSECIKRNRMFHRLSKYCTKVILSSKDAQSDLAKFEPAALPSSRVLHFVTGLVGKTTPVVDESVLRDRYKIVGPYFHLPNQFWVHKNHRVVIDALTLLKANGKNVQVICTGHTKDYRWPDYFDELMSYAFEKGLSDYFRVLGLVPYEDMIGLMKNSVGVINPSLFEGWSTTVEEAISLGITVILSDIPVHREQNPANGIFFDPLMPNSLVNALMDVLDRQSLDMVMPFRKEAMDNLSKRFSDFGAAYQSIVLDTFSSKI